MEGKMKALVKSKPEPNHLELKEVAVPDVNGGEVLIRVRAVGICGTDLHIVRDEYDHTVPLILGHEWAGEIAVLGRGVRGWKVGDRVIGELHTKACRTCRLCRSGNEQICPLKRPYGTYEPGALASYFRIPAWLLHHIPPGLSFIEAALIEPTACAIHGYLRVGGVQKQDIVAVLGSGPLGLLLAAYMVRGKKARQVYLTGSSRRSSVRLQLARRLKLGKVIDAYTQDPVEVVRRDTNGEGVDVIFEAAGAADAVRQGIAMLRKDGRMCLLGLAKGEISVPWNDAVKKDLDLIFCFSSGRQAWEEALQAIKRGWIKPREFITKTVPLAKWQEAFGLLERGEAVKVVITI